MRPTKIALIVIGALVALVGCGLIAAGGMLVWANSTQRDAGGYYNTPNDHIDSPGYALTSHADFGSDASQRDWVPAHPIGTVRLEATSGAGAVFVGIARQADVDAWLAGVAHTHVWSLHVGTVQRDTSQVAGRAAPAPPTSQTFWAASASGPGTQTVIWPSEPGRWAAVVMNADASPGVVATVRVGAKTGVLLPIGIGLGAFGLFALAGSALLLALGLRRPIDLTAAETATTTPAPAGREAIVAGSYPVRVDGRLDPELSRWMWLIKWLLVIPHVIALAFLWLAVIVLTAVAGVAILFTGRYPKAIFEFNSGVFRWTWRVAFYALSAFGTDRYPPFSLAPDPSYPAELTIDYPEHLSRGLVLVKWWLLALPQYLIVAVFAGGWELGRAGTWRMAGGGGLIALLALIAAVILTVQGRYPESIFDLVMGMNRWCYRVLAYAALMRDEYPPFRLDMGGTDPGHRPAVPRAPTPDHSGELISSP